MGLESDARRAARRRRSAGVVADFDGDRLSLARRLARTTRAELARRLELSPAAISQFERGQSRPTAPVAAELGLALGVSGEFFRRNHPVPTLPGHAAHFRSLRSTPALSRDQALAFGELALGVAEVIETYVDLPAVDLPWVALPADPDPHDVAAAARHTREKLGVPPGPVAHVARLLEACGVLVLRLPEDYVDPRVDAFSTQAGHRPLVLLSPLKNDLVRSRFDASHELGHLVMHHDVEPGSKIVEGQAQGFAAEFLMPAEQIAPDLPSRYDLERLIMAKRKWGTSVRALVYRAHALGIMSPMVYRRANQDLAQRGNPEIASLGPPEAPSVLGAATDLLERSGIRLNTIAQDNNLPVEQLRAVIAASSDTRPTVRAAAPTSAPRSWSHRV
ncbi:MAG: XRE family transcriptional regulator [Pseudonocardia sp.]|nr:XRE family transcriptional regulator [Pseudonocardia sp.]